MTAEKTSSIFHRIIHFPLTRIVIGFLVVAFTYGMTQGALGFFIEATSISDNWRRLFIGIISSIVAAGVYIILYKYYEKRDITEFSLKRSGTSILSGILLGIMLQSLTILVIYIMAKYEIISVNNFIAILPAMTLAFTAAVFEEILLRGIIFRITEESLGSYLALLISAILFGAMHIGNPNATIITSAGIAIQAGLLLGVAYMYTRNLWFPIAIHFAWNFLQSGIFGAAVSGHKIEQSLLTAEIDGPTLWTGGAFGPEGSLQATIFCVIAMLGLLYLCHKNKKIVLPFWKRANDID